MQLWFTDDCDGVPVMYSGERPRDAKKRLDRMIRTAAEVRQRYYMPMDRSLTEEETKTVHNLWMSDVDTWMDAECLQEYQGLLRQADELDTKGKGTGKKGAKGQKSKGQGKGPRQQAQQLKKPCDSPALYIAALRWKNKSFSNRYCKKQHLCQKK